MTERRPLPDAVVAELRANNRIKAIKVLRTEWSLGSKEAIDEVNAYLADHPEIETEIASRQNQQLPEADLEEFFDQFGDQVWQKSWRGALARALRTGNFAQATMIIRAVYLPAVLALLLVAILALGAVYILSRL